MEQHRYIHEGIVLVPKEQGGCQGCYLKKDGPCEDVGCTSSERSDGKYVIWVPEDTTDLPTLESLRDDPIDGVTNFSQVEGINYRYTVIWGSNFPLFKSMREMGPTEIGVTDKGEIVRVTSYDWKARMTLCVDVIGKEDRWSFSLREGSGVNVRVLQPGDILQVVCE